MGNTSPGYEVVVTAHDYRGGREIKRKAYADMYLAYLAACLHVDIYAGVEDSKDDIVYAKLQLLEDGFAVLSNNRIELIPVT